MSSHHVVREKQEPALLILGLEGFDEEHLGQLLEWSPTVIVTDYTAEKVHAWGIKIDWFITENAESFVQENIKRLAANGDATEASLKHLIGQGYPAVNVVTDELSLNDYQRFAGKIDLVIFYNYQKIYPVRSGFSKWKPAGEVLEIIGAAESLWTEGLANIGRDSFQTMRDGLFSVKFDEPFLFIAEAF